MSRLNMFGNMLVNCLFAKPRFQHQTETLAGNKTLTVDSPVLQFLDPGGSGRTITLPAEADSEGRVFFIFNMADNAEVLTIQDDTPTTIVTPTQNEHCILACDGVSWKGFVGAQA